VESSQFHGIIEHEKWLGEYKAKLISCFRDGRRSKEIDLSRRRHVLGSAIGGARSPAVSRKRDETDLRAVSEFRQNTTMTQRRVLVLESRPFSSTPFLEVQLGRTT
jgi:hypothetical protein